MIKRMLKRYFDAIFVFVGCSGLFLLFGYAAIYEAVTRPLDDHTPLICLGLVLFCFLFAAGILIAKDEIETGWKREREFQTLKTHQVARDQEAR